jgi:hypothetical protein
VDDSEDAWGRFALRLPPDEQVSALLRGVREWLASVPESDRPWRARQADLTIGLPQADVTKAVQLFLGNYSRAPAEVITGTSIVPEELITSSAVESVDSLLDTASRDGVAKLSPLQILILALTWLLLVGIPVIQTQLPLEAQSIVTSEVGTVGLGIAITAIIMQKPR